MKCFLAALAIITIACAFGPEPADAGHGRAPGCTQPQLYAPPVYHAPPSCHTPAPQQPLYVPAPQPQVQYTTPSTFVETPPTTVVVPEHDVTVRVPATTVEVPGQRMEVPGTTTYYTPQVVPYQAPPCPYAAPVPGCQQPGYAPGIHVDVDVPRQPLRQRIRDRRERHKGMEEAPADEQVRCKRCKKNIKWGESEVSIA